MSSPVLPIPFPEDSNSSIPNSTPTFVSHSTPVPSSPPNLDPSTSSSPIISILEPFIRKSTRVSKPSLRFLEEFNCGHVSSQSTSSTACPLSSYLSYANLIPAYTTFVFVVTT